VFVRVLFIVFFSGFREIITKNVLRAAFIARWAGHNYDFFWEAGGLFPTGLEGGNKGLVCGILHSLQFNTIFLLSPILLRFVSPLAFYVWRVCFGLNL